MNNNQSQINVTAALVYSELKIVCQQNDSLVNPKSTSFVEDNDTFQSLQESFEFFLQSHVRDLLTSRAKKKSIYDSSGDDNWLLKLLEEFSYNINLYRFDKRLDFIKLRKALYKRVMSFGSRINQVGTGKDAKSFLPGLLLQYLYKLEKEYHSKNTHTHSAVSAASTTSSAISSISSAAATSVSILSTLKPMSMFFEAVTVLVDISGFTRVSGN